MKRIFDWMDNFQSDLDKSAEALGNVIGFVFGYVLLAILIIGVGLWIVSIVQRIF